MNKTTIFFLIPLIVLACIALLSLILLRGSRKTTIPPFPSPTTARLVYPTHPTSETIESKGVEIKNPFTGAKDYTTQGDALTVKTEDFEIVYLAKFDEFVITVNAEPFEAKRKLAESAFLKRLGISESEACKLNVSLSPPKKEGELTPRFGLSFCE